MRFAAAGCEFQVVEAPLEEPFLGYYRASARMWNQLRREFLYAAEQVASPLCIWPSGCKCSLRRSCVRTLLHDY